MLLLEQFENLTLHPKNAARLKELVLQLAVQGKLTENWRSQNHDMEPAAELLKRIEAEKVQLVKEKKLKKVKAFDSASDDDAPYTLPIGWAWCQMESIVEIKSSNIKGLAQGSEDDIPYVKVGDMNSAGNETEILSSSEYFSVPAESIDSCIPTRSIIFPKRGGAIATNKRRKVLARLILIDSNMMAFTVPININYDYIYRWFETIDLGKLGNNGVIPQINNQDIYPLFIPIPPLAEQEAIVARVEELMQKIEELEKQTAERIQLKQHLGAAALQQLTAAEDEELEQNWLFLKQHFQTIFDEAANVKKLRETVLQLAVQGKLTATWRKQNLTTEPASELLKRIEVEKAQLVKEKKIKKEKPLEPISEDEVPYALPEGWVWCRMADIASKLGAGSTPKGGKEVYVEEGVPFLRSQNIYDDGLRLNGVAQITEAVHQKMSGTHVQPKDILLNITGGSIGRCALVADDFDTANVSQHVAIIRLVDSDLRKYIHYLMTSDMIQRLIMDVQVGVSREGLSMTKLREFLIPLPALVEQEAIVAKVDQLMQLCDELEQQIQQSKQEADALMQAVVQEALQVQEEVVI